MTITSVRLLRKYKPKKYKKKIKTNQETRIKYNIPLDPLSRRKDINTKIWKKNKIIIR